MNRHFKRVKPVLGLMVHLVIWSTNGCHILVDNIPVGGWKMTPNQADEQWRAQLSCDNKGAHVIF